MNCQTLNWVKLEPIVWLLILFSLSAIILSWRDHHNRQIKKITWFYAFDLNLVGNFADLGDDIFFPAPPPSQKNKSNIFVGRPLAILSAVPIVSPSVFFLFSVFDSCYFLPIPFVPYCYGWFNVCTSLQILIMGIPREGNGYSVYLAYALCCNIKSSKCDFSCLWYLKGILCVCGIFM